MLFNPDKLNAVNGGGKDTGKDPKDGEEPKKSTKTGPDFRKDFFLSKAEAGKPDEGEKRSEKFKFDEKTREGFKSFLSDFVTDNNRAWQKDKNILKFRPHAEKFFSLLGGETRDYSDETVRAAIDKRIDDVLNTPEGWVYTKTLMEEEIAFDIMSQGFISGIDNPDRSGESPGAAFEHDPKEPGKWRKVKNFTRRHTTDTRLGRKALETTAGEWTADKAGKLNAYGKRHPWQRGAALGLVAGSVVNNFELAKDAAIWSKDFAVNVLSSDFSWATIGVGGGNVNLLLATMTGAAIGGIEAKRRAHKEAKKGPEKFVAASEGLEALKNTPGIADYLLRTRGIDIKQIHVNVDTGEITTDSSSWRNGSMRPIQDRAERNLASRDSYYADLGVPPADRTIMPEKSFINNSDGLSGSIDVIEQQINEKVRLMTKTKDSFGNSEFMSDGVTPNPNFRKKEASEQPVLNSFLKDQWGQGPDSPWYYRMDGEGRSLPRYKDSNIRRIKRKVRSIKRAGIAELEEPNDKFGQAKYIETRDGRIDNPFWGKADGRAILGNANYDKMGKDPSLTDVRFRGDTVDIWGQHPGDPGFGRADMRSYFKVPDRLRDTFKKKDILGAINLNKVEIALGAPDKFGQPPESIWYGTGIDGSNIVDLPEVSRGALPNGDQQEDIWGQPPGSKYHGRMDGNLARRDATFADAQRDVVPLEVKQGCKDIWGQKPDNPFYGRKNGAGLTVPDDPADLGEFKTEHFAPVNLVDIWGQSPKYPNGDENPFYQVINKAAVSAFDINNFDRKHWKDQFGQPYLLDPNDADSINPFFSHIDERTIPWEVQLKFIDKKYWEDVNGQAYLRSTGRNPFFGIADESRLYTTYLELYNPVMNKNFHPRDLTDSEGRKFDHPFFGRGKVQSRNRLGKMVDIDLPDPNDVVIRNNFGSSPIDAYFWVEPHDFPLVKTFNPTYFNPATGKDNQGWEPGHPLFCRDVPSDKFRQPSIADFTDPAGRARDKWGQNPGDLTYGIRGPEELAELQNDASIEKFMEARVLVLGDLAEALIRRVGESPSTDVASYQQKIKDRQMDADNPGKVLEDRQSKARDEIKLLNKGKTILTKRKEALEAYKKAEEEVPKAKKELKKYIKTKFGAELEAKTVLDNLRGPLRGTGSFTGTIDGKPLEIKPVAEQQRAAVKERNDEFEKIDAKYEGYQKDRMGNIVEVSDEGKITLIKPRVEIEQEAITAKQLAEDKLTRELQRIQDEMTMLSTLQAEIEGHEENIKQMKDALGKDTPITKGRDTALMPTDVNTANDVNELFRNYTPNKLVNKSVREIMEEMNEKYKTSNATVGWPEDENETHMEALLYAKLEAQELLGASAELKSIRSFGISQEQILTLDETALQQLYDSTPGTTAGWLTIDKIASLKAEAATLKDEREKSGEKQIDRLLTANEQDIRQATRESRIIPPEIETEVKLLEVTSAVVTRQETIFNASREILADVDSYIPVTGTPERLKKVADLTPYERSKMKPGETADANTNLVTLKFWEILTGYQDSDDVKETLAKVKNNLPEADIERFVRESLVPPIDETAAGYEQVMMSFRKNINMITPLQLHEMSTRIIDHVKAKADALP